MTSTAIHLKRADRLSEFTLRSYVTKIKSTKYNSILRDMCENAKRLYNVGLYELRQYRKATGGKHMSYAALDKHLRQTRKNVYYRLHSTATQDTLRTLDAARKGFFARLKRVKVSTKF